MSYYNKSKEEKVVFLFSQLRQEDKDFVIKLLEQLIKFNTEITNGTYLDKNQSSLK